MNKKVICISLFFFLAGCGDRIPLIDIIANEVEWDRKLPCMIVYHKDLFRSITLPANIEYRGGISSQYDKKSFSVEFDYKVSFGDIDKDDDWILNASYIDKTFMRHKLSYDLFTEMNTINRAAKSAYVNISFNGEYNGLYVLMEELNAACIGLDKSDTMSVLFKEPLLFFEERIIEVADSNNYYHQKYPKIYNKDFTYLIEDFKTFLFQSSEEEFASKISKWVDINNVLDWHLFLLLSNNSDGLLKNFYLYKVDGNTPFRFAIWDCDHSFGRDGDNEINLMERELDCNRSILLKRLNHNQYLNYETLLAKRWEELRRYGIFSLSNIEAKVKANKAIINSAVNKNFEKWPYGGDWYFDSNTFDEEIEILLDYIVIRIPQLDSRFKFKDFP